MLRPVLISMTVFSIILVPTKNPYSHLTDKLLAVYCGYFGENQPYHNGSDVDVCDCISAQLASPCLKQFPLENLLTVLFPPTVKTNLPGI